MRTVDSELFEVRAEGRHAPFKATVAFLSILVLHERLILFVDWIVGQVGVLGLLACQVLILILLRGEAHQALSVNVDAQRVVASHHDIEPQIKFMTLDQ